MTRHCSECDKELVNDDGSAKPAGTITCSKNCRQRRQRRIKREKHERRSAAASLPEGLAEAAQITSGKVKSAAHEVLKEELRPVVAREVLTDRVLGSVQRAVGLTPRALELLEAHMESGDEAISQRAVTLLLKYTLGNPSVAPAAAQEDRGALTVQFNIPRPGDDAAPAELVADAEELRECLDCRELKPTAQFVGNSDRCSGCFGGMRDLLRERFGDAYSS